MPMLKAADVEAVLRQGGPANRDTNVPARFKAGDRVIVRNINPTGHTRAPRYVRGKTGVIERHYGAHVFPDSNAHGQGPDPRHLYSVRFTGRDLWGEEAPANDAIYLDLWEPYLEPA